MKKTLIISSVALGFLARAAGLVFAAGNGIPQASITLQNSDAKYCYTHNNTWTLTKEVTGNTVTDGVGTVTWHITATKDSSGAPTFTVHGGLTVTNTGTAPATIGNIVINLQKPNNPKKGSNAPYVSIAADVADATNGDAATMANIVAAGSQENQATNVAWLANNYAVIGAQGTFGQNIKSGSLEFKDASDNSVFSLHPQPVIPVGQSITLLYDATFNTSALPPAGTPMRVEALVTFGNAGFRGGSGSTATNIDINGDGAIHPDETNVRTVASRVALAALPTSPDQCNDSVNITDTGATTTGTVTASNPIGFDAFSAVINSTTSWDVSVDVDGGALGGDVCNAANLDGAACGGTLNVVVDYDDLGNPIYATYECAAAANAEDSACVEIGPPQGFDFCSYTQGKFNSNANNSVANYLQANFATLFPSGLTIGIVGVSTHDATWTNVTAFRTWIGGGGSSDALTADTLNATSTSGGTLAKQTAALTINLALSGVMVGDPAGLGALKLCNFVDGSTDLHTGKTITVTGAATLNTKTVADILADANNALGGNGLPSYIGSFGHLTSLVEALNLSFDDCAVGPFAAAYLCMP